MSNSNNNLVNNFELKNVSEVYEIDPNKRYAFLIKGCDEKTAMSIGKGLQYWLSENNPMVIVFLSKENSSIEFIPEDRGEVKLLGKPKIEDNQVKN